jgi:hypothetical protein
VHHTAFVIFTVGITLSAIIALWIVLKIKPEKEANDRLQRLK